MKKSDENVNVMAYLCQVKTFGGSFAEVFSVNG